MKNLKCILFVVIIMMTFSCENEPDNENISSCFQIDLNDKREYQLDGEWTFLGFRDSQTHIEECKPEYIKRMNINFIDSGKFNALSSCNFFNGSYLVASPDSIKILQMVTTLMYCANDTVCQWEEKYFNELKNARNYSIIGNRLCIETTAGEELIFRTDEETR